MDRKPVKAKDRIGQVFGSLKINSVYYIKDKRNANLAMAECICVCGNVINIRRRISNGEKSLDLAKEYGVSKTTISEVKTKKVWGHI